MTTFVSAAPFANSATDPSAPNPSVIVPLGPPRSSPPALANPFIPVEPATLEETGLLPTDVEALVLKLLLTSGPTVGRKIAEQIRLPFGLMAEQLRSLRAQLLLTISNQGEMSDFEYDLTDDGRKRAHWHAEQCTYCGAAPVPLEYYVASVEQQSLRKLKIKLPDICRALADLMLAPITLSQLGQAVHAGRGLFLYGQPGNGKTSIAERLIKALSPYIWIPRTITVTGEIIRLFDPANHTEAPLESPQDQFFDTPGHDRRWVRIRRPLIVVGGELRLDQLEITHNPNTGILESAVQLKSNGGALVIDDFGRQRCSASDLLNRWIVPLEKGHDYLNLPSGRQIQIPFDQLLVFSTNLPPQKLVDEAFLRRIPYKIEVNDPSPREYRELVLQWCTKLGVEYQSEAVDYLLANHYQKTGRSLRYCHPRDLVQQVLAFCEFHDLPLILTTKALDVAAKNYFAGL
jgi:predicted ATPase with chaperone activity